MMSSLEIPLSKITKFYVKFKFKKCLVQCTLFITEIDQ